jgi:tRNA dimethylallyltransferase
MDRASPELPPLIVLAGATATGKTALSLGLADRIQGLEIVSADSRQVYKGMDIGTAKVTPGEREAVPHHCLDLVDPDVVFTAADYRRTALDALEAIASRGGMACLVGGTGLYLRTVARGFPLDRGAADDGVRADLEAALVDDGLDSLADRLRAGDPEAAASIDMRNPRRVVRALERLALTGSGLPPKPTGYPGSVAWLGIERQSDEHRRAVADRVVEQFDAGLLEEAERLRTRYPAESPAFSALGYREAFDVLDGLTDLATAIETDTSRTWAYARRQRSWFRGEPDIMPIEGGAGDLDRAMLALGPFLGALGGAEYAGGA